MLDAIKKAIAYLHLLALVPTIIENVRALESVISGPGLGPVKLKALIDIIRLIWELVPDDLAKVLKFDVIEGFVKSVVGVLVGAFNDAGAFQKPK